MLLSEIKTKDNDKTITAKIYITQADNDKYFGQKLPTWRDAFCYISRKVTLMSDPDEIYDDGEYGILKTQNGQALIVTGDPKTGMDVGGIYKPKLSEAMLQTVKADDLWDQNADNIAEYRSVTQYQVRPIADSSPTKYEAFSINGSKSTAFGEFNSIELAKVLQPIRPNQTPDAEGFITYVDPMKVEAFQYNGEPCKIELDNTLTVKLSKGDYVERTVKGSTFKYSVEDENTFESTLRKS
jgi:hypothetical protein